MEVKNCRQCKRLFNYIGGQRLCPECKEKLEEKFQEVKKYIEENKNATVSMVSEELGVSTQQITQWIREERLIFAEGSPVTIGCESCGAPIRTGRFCEKCKSSMANQLNSIYKTNSPGAVKDKRDRAKMRFLDGQ